MEKIWLKYYDEKAPATIRYPESTLYRLFRLSVEKNPSGTATLFYGARVAYQELKKQVDRFAAALQSLGIEKGDRVAVILPNLPAYPIVHFACLRQGAVLVPTNPLYVERELENQLKDSGARVAVVLDALYPRLARVRERTSVEKIVVTGVQDYLPWLLGKLYRLKNKPSVPDGEDQGVYSLTELIRRTHVHAPAADLTADDGAMLLYTGGTTGISKGAMLTHRNLIANVYQVRHWLWDMQDGKEVLLCVLPFFHSYGLTTGLHLAVISQSAMVLVPRFEVKEVVKRIRKHRPTIFCGVPAMYNAINQAPSIAGRDVSSIRLCVSGGSGLPEEVQKTFEKLTGARLVEGYGLSEASPVALVNPIHGTSKPGSVGVPLPDTEARVVDLETREPLPPGQAGELAVRGPQVMQGYWNRPAETAEVLQEGWLHTGDIAVMDTDGFFSIVDRKKDLIISAGMNVYPREVEEVLHQHPKVAEAAVLAVPNPLREQVVKAYIAPRDGETLTRAEVIQFCQDKLAKYKIPREVEFRKELPKSAVGKVLKRVLKEEESKTRSGERAPGSGPAPREAPDRINS